MKNKKTRKKKMIMMMMKKKKMMIVVDMAVDALSTMLAISLAWPSTSPVK